MEKAEKKLHISIAVVLCDKEIPSVSTTMNYEGQGHYLG